MCDGLSDDECFLQVYRSNTCSCFRVFLILATESEMSLFMFSNSMTSHLSGVSSFINILIHYVVKTMTKEVVNVTQLLAAALVSIQVNHN